jgi:hypothetical protein
MKEKFPWLFTRFKFSFDPRLEWWKEGSVIWLGTEIQKGDPYHRIANVWTIDITIANLGFKLIIEGFPAMTNEYLVAKRKLK